MQLYIKTPLHHGSKTVPHLVEHCVGHAWLSARERFQYEKKIIKQELSDCSYAQRIYEASLRKVTGKKINLNHPESVSFEDVVAYHQERYQKSNMIFCKECYTPQDYREYFYDVPLSRAEAIASLQNSTRSTFQSCCIEKTPFPS